MFTKNFDNLMITQACGVISPNVSTLTETEYQALNNSVSKSYYGGYVKGIIPYSTNSNYRKLGIYQELYLGDGSTTPTYFDYKLAGAWNGTIVMANSGNTLSFTTENNIDYVNIHGTWTNTGSVNKTIREIAIVANMGDAGSTSTTPNTNAFLFYRTVLPEDIIVAPQGAYVVNMKIALTELRPNKPSA